MDRYTYIRKSFKTRYIISNFRTFHTTYTTIYTCRTTYAYTDNIFSVRLKIESSVHFKRNSERYTEMYFDKTNLYIYNNGEKRLIIINYRRTVNSDDIFTADLIETTSVH